jgi:hypothetical protein
VECTGKAISSTGYPGLRVCGHILLVIRLITSREAARRIFKRAAAMTKTELDEEH